MRIPEKPPVGLHIEKLRREDFDKLRPYLNAANSEYLHWDELKINDQFKDIDLKKLWTFIEFSRSFDSRTIGINGLRLRYIQTPNIEKTLHELDMRVAGKIEKDLEAKMGVELQKKYLVNSLMEEAIASSQLEGASTSRLVAKKMLRENRKPRTRSEQMILNNYITMRYIKEHVESNQKLTFDLIREIHKRITNDTLDDKKYEGAFRTTNDIKVFSRDGRQQIIYDPPEYSQIDQLLEQVCNFVNGESTEYYLHPFVKAMVLHYMIGWIHPFFDGNGRTARALFYWYLLAQNYDYLEYVAISTAINNAPAQYTRAYLYAETDNNDVTYFVKFNLHAMDIAITSFEKYIEKTKEENKRIFETIRRNPKMNFRQADLIISLSKSEQSITIYEMKERYNTTYQTARTDLFDLTERGYLHKLSRGKQFVFVLDKERCLQDKAL